MMGLEIDGRRADGIATRMQADPSEGRKMKGEIGGERIMFRKMDDVIIG